MEIILIRHAESANNRLWADTGGNVGREAEPALTELGHRQAEALAAWFMARDVTRRPTHLYSSLMRRAVQTAAPLAATSGLPLVGRTDCFEVYGPYDEDASTGERSPHPGLGRADLQDLVPDLTLPDDAGEAGWWRGPVEESDGATERARGVVSDILASHAAHDRVALVTHGLFFQYLVCALLDIPEMSGWILVNNTGVTTFEVSPHGTVLLALNQLQHLDQGQVTE